MTLISFILCGIVIDEESMVACHGFYRQGVPSFYVQIHEAFVHRSNVRSKIRCPQLLNVARQTAAVEPETLLSSLIAGLDPVAFRLCVL